jgi:hypothetical protein
METETAWYYLQDSRQIGPYTQAELEELLERGVISAETLVWTKHRSWEPMGGSTQVPEPPAREHGRSRTLLLAAALFCGGLSFQTNSPGPNSAGHEAAMFVSQEISYDKMQAPEGASLAVPNEQVRTPALSAGNQLVQEYWRAIAHSKVIGRYEYYLRRSPSGSFAEAAVARIKELSSEAPPQQPKVKPKKTKVASAVVRPAKAQLNPTVPVVTKKNERRCWTRNIEECRERCRNGEKTACQKLVRLGG